MYQIRQFIPEVTQPVVYQQQQQRQHVGEKQKKAYKRLGTIQVVLGVMSILFAVINIIIAATYSNNYGLDLAHVGDGIWCGGMILTCGILGLRSAKKPSHCPIIAAMVMTIVTATACVPMIAIEIVAAVQGLNYYSSGCYSYTYPSYHYYYTSPRQTLKVACARAGQASQAFHGLLAVIAVAAFICAIIHSSYCCASVCCGRKKYQTQNVVYTAAATNQPPGVQIGVGQYYPQFQPQYTMVSPQYAMGGNQPHIVQAGQHIPQTPAGPTMTAPQPAMTAPQPNMAGPSEPLMAGPSPTMSNMQPPPYTPSSENMEKQPL